jgi:hypothetical protein
MTLRRWPKPALWFPALLNTLALITQVLCVTVRAVSERSIASFNPNVWSGGVHSPSISQRNMTTDALPTVAANASGLLLEVHRLQKNWYYVGQVNGAPVTWGYSQRTGANGNRPIVAMDSNGVVILVHTGFDNDELYYQVGKLNPKLGVNQSITWVTDFGRWDRGSGESSIAMNDNRVILGVHQSNTGSDALYNRVGQFANSSGGLPDSMALWPLRHTIREWAPSIALNHKNQPVEIHEFPPTYWSPCPVGSAMALAPYVADLQVSVLWDSGPIRS